MLQMKEKILAFLGALSLWGLTAKAAFAVSKLPLPKGIMFIPTKGTLESSVITIINWGLSFVGLIAVIFLIYGGFTYITSSGDDQATSKAKNIILYSVIGIVVILLSFVIVATVANIL
jgi:hypothetical protein